MRDGGRLIWRYRRWRNPTRDPEVLASADSTMHESQGGCSRHSDAQSSMVVPRTNYQDPGPETSSLTRPSPRRRLTSESNSVS